MMASQRVNYLLHEAMTLLIKEMNVQGHALRSHFKPVEAAADLHGACRCSIAVEAVAVAENNGQGFCRSLVGPASLQLMAFFRRETAVRHLIALAACDYADEQRQQ